MVTNNKQILIVAPAWVGDMVMAQTLFKLLKESRSNCDIDILAPDWTRPLTARMPEIRHAYPLPIKHKELALSKRFQIAKQLRQLNYDEAIILPNSLKSALIPYLARIPQRTGWLGEWRYGLLNDIRHLDKQRLPLMIERFMALGIAKDEKLPAPYPKPKLEVKSSDVQTALEKYQLDPIEKPVIALCPGAEYGNAKRWPAEHFAGLAQQKLAEGFQVWLFGSANDKPQAAIIQDLTEGRCQDLIGKTSLAEAIDLMAVVGMVVCNDSGLLHIAAALQKPVVVMYGSSSPLFTPPLTQNAKTLSLNLACSPCYERECRFKHLRCLQDLSIAMVTNAMDELNA